MSKSLSLVVALALALSTFGSSALAAKQCRDSKGKFIKCPATAPAKPQQCKDAKGKFVKCGAPGAKPVK